MPVNTSNPLYQNIQSTAEEVKNLYTNQPTFMNTVQNGVVNNDATLNSNVNDYSSAVDELFAHDKTIANTNLSDPMFSQGNTGYVADPMAREKLSADTFALEGSRVASSLNRLEKRKIFLAGLVDKAVKLYETGVSGKEFDYKKAQADFDNSISSMNAQTSRMNAETSASAAADGKTAKERLRNDNLRQLTDDIKTGATIQDVMDRYAKDLDQSDIIDTYNNKSGGKVKESVQTLNTMYRAAKAGSSTLDLIGQISNKNVANEVAANALMAADSKAFLQQLGTENPGYVDAIISGNFPLAKKLAAKFGKDSSFYAQLNAYSANVIKQYYGSAFTSTEVTAARQWVANPTVQNGNQLYASLVANNLTASRRIATSLKTVGITDENYINSYLNQIGGNYNPSTGGSTNSSKTTSGTTSGGYKYTIEQTN